MHPRFDEIFSDEVAVDIPKPEQILLSVAVHTNFADVAPLRKNVSADLEDEHALIARLSVQRAVIQVAQLRGDSLSVLAEKNPRVADSRQIFAPKCFAIPPLLVVGSVGDNLEENFQILRAQPPTKNFAGLRVDAVPTKTLVSETRIAQPPIKHVQTSFAHVDVVTSVDGLNQRTCRSRENIFVRGKIFVQPPQQFNLRGKFDVSTEEMFQRGVHELRRLEEIRQAQSLKCSVDAQLLREKF